MDNYQKEVKYLQNLLYKINKLETKQQKKLKLLLEQCSHNYEKNIKFKETLAFDNTPASFCSVCGKEAGSLEKDQILKLYKEYRLVQ